MGVAPLGSAPAPFAPGSAAAGCCCARGCPATASARVWSRGGSASRSRRRGHSRAPGSTASSTTERSGSRPTTASCSSRASTRELFFGPSGLRRNLRWDALDATYFAGYAWWNYLNAPYLLAREDVRVAEIEPWDQRGETWRRLEARFPAGLDTHSPVQTFYFDSSLMLRRHDYVAEVVGRWARAAHMCADHVEAGGLTFPTRRWVRPIGPGNRPLPAPTLVSLQLFEIEVE